MKTASRNTRFFWVMLAVLLVALYIGIRFVSTVDSCGEGSPNKRWNWAPPGWVCTYPIGRY
jgi:hypothetical protein